MKKIIYFFLVIVMIFGSIQVKAVDEEIDTGTVLKSFNELYSYILYYYVDEPDIAELLRGAMKGMVETLDVHTTYLSEEEFEDSRWNSKAILAVLVLSYNRAYRCFAD